MAVCPSVLAAVVRVGAVFSLSSLVLYVSTVALAREMGASGRLFIPQSVDGIRNLVDGLQQHKTPLLYLVFSLTYLYKQTFAIPGSAVLNVLAGALFGVWVGTPLVCVLSACGASLCFLLSQLVGQDFVKQHFNHRVQPLKDKLTARPRSLLLLLVSLRLFPGTPNWLINLTSPLLGIPLHMFFLSVLIGLFPYNLVCVQAGLTLVQLTSIWPWGVVEPYTYLTMIASAGVAMVTSLCLYRAAGSTSHQSTHTS